jgi:hypothetical protein
LYPARFQAGAFAASFEGLTSILQLDPPIPVITPKGDA